MKLLNYAKNVMKLLTPSWKDVTIVSCTYQPSSDDDDIICKSVYGLRLNHPTMVQAYSSDSCENLGHTIGSDEPSGSPG